MYTGLSHYRHKLLLSPCLGQEPSLMSPNIDITEEDSGKPAHLIQVREPLEGKLSRGTSSVRSSLISVKILLHIPWWRCQKIQWQQMSSQHSQGRGPDTGRVGEPQPWLRKPLCVLNNNKKEWSNRDFIILYLLSIYCSTSTNPAPINEFICLWCPSTTD